MLLLPKIPPPTYLKIKKIKGPKMDSLSLHFSLHFTFHFTTRRKEVDSVGRLKDSTCKTSHFLAGNPFKNEKYENLKFWLQTIT